MLQSKKKYTATISYDDHPINPRHSDNLGTMVCWHKRYNLGDTNEYQDNFAFLLGMLQKAYGSEEKANKKFLEIKKGLNQQLNSHSLINAIISDLQNTMLILPVYLYDHGTLVLSNESFMERSPHAEFDSGQVGWIYAEKIGIENEYGSLDEGVITAALSTLVAETKLYGHYINGENYILNLKQEGELVESIGGFTGDLDDVMEQMREYIKQEYIHDNVSSQEVNDVFGIDSPTVVSANENELQELELKLPNEEEELEP